ncbi:BLOC-2 complex member HPS3 [Hetaerina americana]|uniref:BLOC-2 complex member HPS3 n=1 Tax=Hetaerina americana TaxID=62018 RepID=UPI003A7F55EF
MVRVISVHHFGGQGVEGCGEEVVGAAVDEASNRLLLALPTHTVQVRSLTPSAPPPFMFPTVDRVVRMLHCSKGNYVATLEMKRNRQGGETTYARAYVNWDAASANYSTEPSGLSKEKESDVLGLSKENNPSAIQQPIRARIAGRVTPSGSQWWPGPLALEMLELPLRRAASPDSPMAVCNTTGNLVIGLGHNLVLFAFRNPTHRLSKLRYIDFEESFSFELSFRPSFLLMVEDLVACMSKEYLHVFRVGMDEVPEGEGDNEDQLVESTAKGNVPKIEVVYFPSIVEHDRSLRMTVNAAGHPGPFREASQLTVVVGPRPLTNPLSPSAPPPPSATDSNRLSPPPPAIHHVLRLQILACAKLGREEFRCLTLRPLYTPTTVKEDAGGNMNAVDDEDNSRAEVLNPMRSSYHKDLASIMFFVATQQEGYLYHFPGSKPIKTGPTPAKALLPDAVYPLTAPVSSVVMEQYAVHALTETGLETYTIRASKTLLHQLEKHAGLATSRKHNAYPSCEDPVSLIGLRPFFGVEHLLLTHRYLVLLASCSSPSEGSPSTSSQDSPVSISPSGVNTGRWTQYSLQLPSPTELFHDMMQVGNAHMSSNPATYLHLLSEGHLVLRLALRSISHPQVPNAKWKKTVKGACDDSDLNVLFEESCALLGDQYIRNDVDSDGVMAASYYHMAGLTPPRVIDRILGDGETKEDGIPIAGLIRYIRRELLSPDAEKGIGGDDPLAGPDGEAFSLRILSILEDHSPENVSLLVLRSSALLLCRQGIERVLKVLKERQQSLQMGNSVEKSMDTNDEPPPPPQDALALAIVCLHRGCPDRACAVLSSLGAAGHLVSVLEQHSSLLFEQDEEEGLSELAGVVAEACPEALAEVLGNKSSKGGPKVLAGAVRALREKVAAAGSAAEGASTGKALRLLLEKHFTPVLSGKLEENSGSKDTLLEELKMLVRSYLAGLITEVPLDSPNGEAAPPVADSVNEWEIFGPRLPFLEKMSPFNSESRKKSSGSTSNPPSDGQRMCLIKLQSILCSKRIHPECVTEVRQFLQGCPMALGRHSLLALCLPPREATLFLLEICPQTLLQYAKDKYAADNDWKYLLLLLQRRLLTSQEQSPMRGFYTKILRDALSHLAHTMTLEEFVKVLPPGGGKGEVATYVAHYLRCCQQVQHANHIRSLIIATGNQLLSTLNL